MKRLCVLLALLILWSTTAFAVPFGGGGVSVVRGKILVYECTNSTGDYSATKVALIAIPAGSRILGYSCVPYDQTLGWELVVGLNDYVTDKGSSNNECIAEGERGDENQEADWFAYPLTVETQLILTQGANTTVYIYYTRR